LNNIHITELAKRTVIRQQSGNVNITVCNNFWPSAKRRGISADSVRR